LQLPDNGFRRDHQSLCSADYRCPPEGLLVWQNRAVAHPASRGPGRPPAAKAGETRGRILRAARGVFSEIGYDAATFQEIATRADLTRPAINHHFPTKAILFRQVAEQTTAVVTTGIAAAWREQSFAGRIEAFVRAAGQAQEEDRTVSAFLVVSMLESQRHPELLSDGKGALDHTRDFMIAVIREGVSNGELPADTDAGVVSEMLIAMLWGLGFYAGFVDDTRQMLAVTDEFLRLVVAGCLSGGG
jgi:AcrR family transcriptional regulator